MFPGAKALEGRYPYLKDRAWLLPLAWTQRLAGYLRKGESAAAGESLRIGKARVALLKQYGILPEKTKEK